MNDGDGNELFFNAFLAYYTEETHGRDKAPTEAVARRRIDSHIPT